MIGTILLIVISLLIGYNLAMDRAQKQYDRLEADYERLEAENGTFATYLILCANKLNDDEHKVLRAKAYQLAYREKSNVT